MEKQLDSKIICNRLFLRRHISNSSINTDITSWSLYLWLKYLTLQYWIIDKTSINIYLFFSSPRLCKNTKEPSYSDSVDCSREGLEDQVSQQPKSPIDNDDIATTPPSSCLEVPPNYFWIGSKYVMRISVIISPICSWKFCGGHCACNNRSSVAAFLSEWYSRQRDRVGYLFIRINARHASCGKSCK